jgi:hypothetical protein
MSGSYENDNARWTQEQIRDYKERRLRTKKADALADFFGISRDVDQEEWEEQQTNLQNYGAGPSKSHETSVRLILKFEPFANVGTNTCQIDQSRQNSGDVHFKSAQVHNPTTNEVTEVTVIEDSACQLNFISREVAELCHLTIYPTARVENATLMGSFHSDQWTEVSWLGKNGNNGFDQFYIAPDGAPIQLLVGTRFMSDNPDVFMSQTLAKPAFLNVQKKIKASFRPIQNPHKHTVLILNCIER